MGKIFNRLLRDKLLLVLAIAVLVAFVVDFVLIIFDIVELIKVSKAATRLSTIFVGFNIFGIVLNLLVVIFGVVYFILKRREVKSKLTKE